MRAAAERIWWQNKTPGKGEFRTFEGSLYRMKDPGFSDLEIEVLHEGPDCSGNRRIEIKGLFDRYKKTILAWHRANYVLEDDEYYGQDGPVKMRDDQVRCVDGSLEQLCYSSHGDPDVNLDTTCSYRYFLDGCVRPNHPMNIPGQRTRIEAFLARNAKATEGDTCCSPVCIIDDDGDRLEMSKHHENTKGWLTVTGGRSGRSSGVYLSASDLRKLAETATKIADRIEGKLVGRPVPIE